MTMKSFLRLGRLCAPAMIVAFGLASVPLPAGAQTPIRIGASMSVTGTYAKPGTYQRDGYEVCIDELNAKGGLLGRKVELVIYDDQSQPATAVRLYEKLITEDKVDAVMRQGRFSPSSATAKLSRSSHQNTSLKRLRSASACARNAWLYSVSPMASARRAPACLAP